MATNDQHCVICIELVRALKVKDEEINQLQAKLNNQVEKNQLQNALIVSLTKQIGLEKKMRDLNHVQWNSLKPNSATDRPNVKNLLGHSNALLNGAHSTGSSSAPLTLSSNIVFGNNSYQPSFRCISGKSSHPTCDAAKSAYSVHQEAVATSGENSNSCASMPSAKKICLERATSVTPVNISASTEGSNNTAFRTKDITTNVTM